MNKQIEEMARDLCECYNCDGTCYLDDKPCDLKCDEYIDAQYLYIKSYRKQIEGEWVVAKTERAWNDAEYPYMHRCSLCGNEEASQSLTPYCPNCGAHMSGGNNDE